MGKFDKYKIDLKGMQADSCKYEFVLDNLFFANIDGPEVQKGKVNVVLVVKKTSRAFELNFQTDGMVWVPCDRCLDDMEQLVSSTDKLLVKFGHEYAEEGDNLIVIPEDDDYNNPVPYQQSTPLLKLNKQQANIVPSLPIVFLFSFILSFYFSMRNQSASTQPLSLPNGAVLNKPTLAPIHLP